MRNATGKRGMMQHHQRGLIRGLAQCLIQPLQLLLIHLPPRLLRYAGVQGQQLGFGFVKVLLNKFI